MNDTTIDPGTYTARATRWHWDTPKSGDGMCLAMMLRIEEGPYAGTELRGTLYFDTERTDAKTGKTAADRSIDALRCMGLVGGLDSIDDNGGGGLSTGLASVKVEINEYGKPFAKYINAHTPFTAFAPPGAQAKQAFFAQMNARLRAAEQGARAAGTARPAPAPQRAPAPRQPPRGFDAGQGDDSDVPF